MKIFYGLSCLFLLNICFADEAPTLPTDITAGHIKNRPPVSPQYDNRFGFSWNRLVYERTKADSLYAGLDIWAEGFSTLKHHERFANCYSISSSYWWHEACDETYRTESGLCLRGEARFGYNFFFNGRDHLTPIATAGYFTTIGNRSVFLELAYGGAGFLYSHEFNTVFGWGLQLKGLLGQLKEHYKIKEHHIDGYRSVFQYNSYRYDPLSRRYVDDPIYSQEAILSRKISKKVDKLLAWGIDFTLPIIFRFGHYRHWDVTLEPSVGYIGSKNITVITWGSLGTLAYRF